MKSKKELELEKTIISKLSGKCLETAKLIFQDKEIEYLMNYSNNVSIKRLGFNDHGPVHMKRACLNSLLMFELLHNAGVKFNLENEGIGNVDDSKIAVIIASLLHDIGMSVSRENHEIYSSLIGLNIIDRILEKIYQHEFEKHIIVRSMVIEGIIGHMATKSINSLEAGLVLIGDGCDMEKGRARITSMIQRKPRVGDIHKYSASAIQTVSIEKGIIKPIKITVLMRESVGFFQIEEVLFPKISSSPVKPYIELFAGVIGDELMQYL
ncbi:MAG: phosphohydrolase [candidate division WOR-3 bacterium]|uniref:Phosphohydrolase n=1 Tax=candidate division WOR-3 bacterium TaxID=2052148 RepID=A0A7C3J6R3_UNCW3